MSLDSQKQRIKILIYLETFQTMSNLDFSIGIDAHLNIGLYLNL